MFELALLLNPNRADTDSDCLNDSEKLSLCDAFNSLTVSLTVHPNGRTMKDYRKIAEDFARHLKAKYGERIERMILFGSVARGEAREDSDVDLIVVTPESTHDLQWEVAGDVMDLLAREGILASVLVLTVGEWRETQDSLFGHRVLAEGRSLA